MKPSGSGFYTVSEKRLTSKFPWPKQCADPESSVKCPSVALHLHFFSEHFETTREFNAQETAFSRMWLNEQYAKTFLKSNAQQASWRQSEAKRVEQLKGFHDSRRVSQLPGLICWYLGETTDSLANTLFPRVLAQLSEDTAMTAQ
jgi:hypothetical protein